MSENTENIATECRKKEFHAYGTQKIFERRVRGYRRALNFVTFLGIAVPASVGGLALAIGTESEYLDYAIGAAGVLAILQLVMSIWSLASGWSAKLERASSSVQGNVTLYNEWKALADYPDDSAQHKIQELRRLDEKQEIFDRNQEVTDKEERYAMRVALFYYGQSCLWCNYVPNPKKPSKCPRCGK